MKEPSIGRSTRTTGNRLLRLQSTGNPSRPPAANVDFLPVPAIAERGDSSSLPGRPSASQSDRSSGTRLSELIAALSFSTDLALGQPMEHVLRACLIALRLADLLDLDDEQRAETYWVTLLATVCTAESFELAQLFGDDIAWRSGMFHVGPSQLAQMVYVLGVAASKPSGRVRAVSRILSSGGKNIEASLVAHCAITRDIADRIGLPARVGESLANTFARWDGKGAPRGVGTEAVQVPVRLMQLADMSEVHARVNGVDGAVQMVGERAGKMFAPELARVSGTAVRRDHVRQRVHAVQQHHQQRDVHDRLGQDAQLQQLQ